MDDAAAISERPRRRPHGGLRIVVGYVITCGVVFLLQLFPYSGIFLMMLAASAWIGVIINVGMIHLAIAAASGLVSRTWLLLPAVFYIGGVALHYSAVGEVAAEIRSIEAANAAAATKAEPPLSFLIKGGPFIELLESYRIDRMVLPLGNRSDSPATIYYYARGDECDSANKGWYYDKRAEPFLMRRDLFPAYKGADKTRQCILSKEARLPSDVHYRLETQGISYDTELVKRFGTQWTVTDAKTNAPVVTVRSAEYTVITLIPMPLAGCGLIDSPPAWKCVAGMMKESTYTGAGYKQDNARLLYPPLEMRPISVLGTALALEPRQPTD